MIRTRMRDMFSRFLRDHRGSVAPMFAIAVIPVIGLTGAAIDYSRANSVRTGMQAAIDATKTASKNLLTQLKNAATTNDDVYVSIIPFNKDVNVGKNNYTSSIRWDLWDSANSNAGGNTFSGSICYNGTLWVVNGTSFSNGGSCTGQSSGICFQGTLWNWNGVSFTSGGSCSGHGNWNGCVTDRDQDYDTQNTAPSASIQATLFPAEQYSMCPVELMPLSYDWTALNNKIDSMYPNGFTNQTIGL